MSYNMTELQNVDTVGAFFTYAYNHSGNFLFGGLLVGFFFIVLMNLKNWNFEEGLAVSSFATFLIGSLGAYIGLVNYLLPLGFGLLTALTGLYLVVSR